MANKGGARAGLQHFVDGGYMTEAELEEVSDFIDAVTEYVERGAMSRSDGDLVVHQIAEEKARDYHERSHTQ